MSSSLALPLSGRPVLDHARPINQNNQPSPSAIRAQLWKVLRSEGFARAERMRRFLEFIVEEALAGRANQLCEYAVAISVFERDESFSPGLDPIVRNDARRLRQKLLEYYYRSPQAPDDQIVIEVPKGGYVPIFKAASKMGVSKPPNYRLVASLIRLADGAEVWNTARNLSLNHKFSETRFDIAFPHEISPITASKKLRLLS